MTYWSVAAVIVVGLVGDTLSNGIVHLLVVGLGRGEVRGVDATVGALQVEVCTSTTCSGETSPQEGVAGGLGGLRLGRIATARTSAEALRESGASAADSRSEGGAQESARCGSSSRCHGDDVMDKGADGREGSETRRRRRSWRRKEGDDDYKRKEEFGMSRMRGQGYSRPLVNTVPEFPRHRSLSNTLAEPIIGATFVSSGARSFQLSQQSVKKGRLSLRISVSFSAQCAGVALQSE